MSKTTILPSNNEAWGFFGTVRHHAEPAQAWPIAFKAVTAATGCAEEGIRDFSTAGTAGISPTTWRTDYSMGKVSQTQSTPRSSAGWAGP